MSTFSTETLKDQIIKIMRKYPDLFPIVSTLEKAYETVYDNKEETREKLIIYELSSFIGLDAMIFYKSINIDTLKFIVKPKDIAIISKYIINSVLLEYTIKFPLKSDLENWQKLLKDENLI